MGGRGRDFFLFFNGMVVEIGLEHGLGLGLGLGLDHLGLDSPSISSSKLVEVGLARKPPISGSAQACPNMSQTRFFFFYRDSINQNITKKKNSSFNQNLSLKL